MRRFFPISLLLAAAATAQTYHPADANLQARTWFQDAKFGMFIHWGVYSVLGDGEWVMNNDKMTCRANTRSSLPQFNPTEFDAAEWVALAKAAGMKYITHHQQASRRLRHVRDRNRTSGISSTPRPIRQRSAQRCWPTNATSRASSCSSITRSSTGIIPITIRAGAPAKPRAVPKAATSTATSISWTASFAELLTELWRDRRHLVRRLVGQARPPTGACRKPTDSDSPPAAARRWSAAIIIAARSMAKISRCSRRICPAGTRPGSTIESEIGTLPLESCDTINIAWGYNSTDKNFKSSKQLIQFLARNAGYGANFLLNIGPMPTGKIQPEI